MLYTTGQMIKVGDLVVADGMNGVIVCDFDNREFAKGYEAWNIPTADIIGGRPLDSGVMVETTEGGMIHYVEGSGIIERGPFQSR